MRFLPSVESVESSHSVTFTETASHEASKTACFDTAKLEAPELFDSKSVRTTYIQNIQTIPCIAGLWYY